MLPLNKFSALFEGRLAKRNLPASLGWELEYSGWNEGSGSLEYLRDLTRSSKLYPSRVPRPIWKPEHCGVESNSPIFTSQLSLDKYLTAFFSFLKEHKFTESHQCGGHLHVGLDKFKPEDLSKFLIAVNLCQPFLFSLMPTYRNKNDYCVKVSESNLKTYIEGVRLAAPLLLEGEKRYEETLAKFPSGCRPVSPTLCSFPAAGPYDSPIILRNACSVASEVVTACEPRYGMGLGMFNLGRKQAEWMNPGSCHPWIRHQPSFHTLEFRLFPTTLDIEEWRGYLAVVAWLTFKFQTDATETLEDILSRSDCALLKGTLPFDDWPQPLLDWLLSHKHGTKSLYKKSKHADNHPNQIAQAEAVA